MLVVMGFFFVIGMRVFVRPVRAGMGVLVGGLVPGMGMFMRMLMFMLMGVDVFMFVGVFADIRMFVLMRVVVGVLVRVVVMMLVLAFHDASLAYAVTDSLAAGRPCVRHERCLR